MIVSKTHRSTVSILENGFGYIYIAAVAVVGLCVRVSIAENTEKKVGLRNTHEKIQLSIPCPLRSCLPFTGETCITHDYIHDEFCLSHFAYWRSVGWSVLELTTVCFVVGPPRIKYIRSRRHTGPRRRRRWRFPFSFFTRSRSFADVVQRIIPISTYCTTECVCVFLCAPPLCRCCWQRGCEASSE